MTKLLNQNPLTRAQRLNLVLQRSGGNKTKAKDAGCITTGLTGSTTDLTGSFKVLQNNSKLKVVKPKKPEISVCKTVQAKGHSKHQKANPKSIGEFPANPQKQRDAKDASWPNKSKQPRSSPKCQFSDKNRQWNNFLHRCRFRHMGLL